MKEVEMFWPEKSDEKDATKIPTVTHSHPHLPTLTHTMKLKILHAILESINSHLRFSTFPTHSIHQTDYLVRVELCCENLPYCGT